MKTALSINQPFKDWVNHLKQDIRSAQIKAAVRVNSELLHLYWQLGAEIIERQKEMTWGSGFLEELSRELMAEFPDMKGFSYRNIRSKLRPPEPHDSITSSPHEISASADG